MNHRDKLTVQNFPNGFATTAELKAAGISCSVRRRDNASAAGCGYALIISGECSQAVAVLRKYSIPFTGVSDGGE